MSYTNLSPGVVASNEGQVSKSINHEVVLVVKFNNSEALVLKEPINLTYYKFGDDTIIGTDGIFYNFYMKDWAGWSKDAFGGRKFTLTMHDGEVVECSGQWWDARSPTAKMLIDQPLCSGTANDVKRLQDCYVFTGHSADTAKWKELRDTYTGPVYEYYDGEFIIKSWVKKHGKLIKLFRDANGVLSAIDEYHDYYQIKDIQGKLYFRYREHINANNWYNRVFTEHIKDFSIREPRSKPVYHKCFMCGSDDATLLHLDDKYYCHRCDKQMTAEDNRRNYGY